MGASDRKMTFLKGAAILGIAGIIIKLLGAVFRIPLANLIGDVGMGYYNGAYPIYVFLLTLSTAGIPTAISKLISERLAVNENQEAHRVFRVSFLLLFIIGLSTTSILFFGAEYICEMVGNPGAYYAMRAISPALLFVPIMAAFRGYFQGMQNMSPTATSQVVEQLFRVFFGLTLAFYLFPVGLEFAAAGASSGAAFGGLFGGIGIIIIYMKKKKQIRQGIRQGVIRTRESVGTILRKILIIAVPVTIGASIMPIMNLIDMALVMNRLQTAAGFTEEAATALYGQLSGMVGAIINFPQVLSMSIAMSLVPVVSAAYKRKETAFLQKNVELGVRTSALIGLPCAFGLMVLAEPIMLLLYPMQKASAVSAAPCLFIMAIGVVFLSIVQTLTGVLQGLGRPSVPVMNLAIGAVVKIICTYTLVGIPSINVKGAALGTTAAYAIAAALDFIAVKSYTKTRFNLSMTFLKPFAAAVLMAVCVHFAYLVFEMIAGNSIATLLSVAVGVGVYALAMLLIKGVTEEELRMLPKGEKLARALKKIQRK